MKFGTINGKKSYAVRKFCSLIRVSSFARLPKQRQISSLVTDLCWRKEAVFLSKAKVNSPHSLLSVSNENLDPLPAHRPPCYNILLEDILVTVEI